MWLGFGGAPRWDRNMPQPLRRQRGAASAKPPGFVRVSRDSAGLKVADPGNPTDATCAPERAESGGIAPGNTKSVAQWSRAAKPSAARPGRLYGMDR